MKNNILASIALFGVYRDKNLDTYDLVAQYISAVIAQKECTQFTPDVMKEDLYNLFGIDIPFGVIRSVSRNRIEGVSLKQGVFYCELIPKDEIDKEYAELTEDYEALFKGLILFMRQVGHIEEDSYSDDDIRNRFADYLLYQYTSESRLNSYYAAFISENESNPDVRRQLDLLSSGLISYNGLSYTEDAGNNGAWTERLTIYLDTEFLFNCSGYNGDYYLRVFDELYNLVNEVNISYRRRTKKSDNLIDFKILNHTLRVYNGFFEQAKMIIDSKVAPDPSKKALLKIVHESSSAHDVEEHKAVIDSVVFDNYHILPDSNDYDNYATDRDYVLFDEKAVTELNSSFNPRNDSQVSGRIDYASRVLTIINGLRGGKKFSVFENCRYIFLTGSRVVRGASYKVAEKGTVLLSTDIDFLVSRLWFKLNKPLGNSRIPISLDIVSRSQAVLKRDVTRKVKEYYDVLLKKDYSDDVKKRLYASLKEKCEFLPPYDESSLSQMLAFIDTRDLDAMLEANKSMMKKAAEAEQKEKELSELKTELDKTKEENKGLKQDIAKKELDHKHQQDDAALQSVKKDSIIKYLIVALVVVFIVAIVLALILILE